MTVQAPIIAEYEKFCAYGAKYGQAFLKGLTLIAERRIAFDARTGRWITAYPNGKEHEGRPLFIGENGRVLAGLGKANGKKLSELHKPETNQPLAWRGSSQRRNTKEDYEEREYWINEKRQSSKKALKREQKRAQKLERQSEQEPQEQSLSPEQKQAEATRQRFLSTPLPDHFETSQQAVDYFNKVAPNVDADNLKLMSAQCAHDVAFAASKLGADFPHAFDKGFTFMLPDAEESRINAEKTKLEAKVNAGTFKAEAAAEFEKLLSDNEFMQSSLYEATVYANLYDSQHRAQALQQLWDIASSYGFDYKTVTISMLANSRAREKLKSVWVDVIASAQKYTKQKELDQRLTELSRLKKRGEKEVFAQWDPELKQLQLISPFFAINSDSNDLSKLMTLYQHRVAIHPHKGFHASLKDGISPLTAVAIHELVHCIDFAPRGLPISSSPQIVELFHEARAQYLSLLLEQDRIRVKAAFSAYDKGATQLELNAPYALYSCQEFVAEQITECLTAPEPTKPAQLTLSLFKQIYNMRVGGEDKVK